MIKKVIIVKNNKTQMIYIIGLKYKQVIQQLKIN